MMFQCFDGNCAVHRIHDTTLLILSCPNVVLVCTMEHVVFGAVGAFGYPAGTGANGF